MTRERLTKPVPQVQRAPEVPKTTRVTTQPVSLGRLSQMPFPAQLEVQRAQQLEVQRLADFELQRAAIQRAHDDRFTAARALQTSLHARGTKTIAVQRAVAEHARSARDTSRTRAAFVAQRQPALLETLVAQRLTAAVCPALPELRHQSELTLSHVADHYGDKAATQLAQDPERLSSYAGFKNAGAGLVKNFRTPGSSHTMPELAKAIRRFRDPMQRAAVESAAFAAFGSHPTYPKQLQRALEEQNQRLELQREAWSSELEPIAQRQAFEEASGEGAAVMIEAARGGGQPLPAGVRAMLETKWNTDLSKVRVHTDSSAASISKKLNAKALTTGQDIFFGASTFNPTSLEGLRLIAHEAWHTVQQAGGLVQAGIDRSASLEVEAQGKGAELSSGDLQASNATRTQTIRPRSERSTEASVSSSQPSVQRAAAPKTDGDETKADLDKWSQFIAETGRDFQRLQKENKALQGFLARLKKNGGYVKASEAAQRQFDAFLVKYPQRKRDAKLESELKAGYFFQYLQEHYREVPEITSNGETFTDAQRTRLEAAYLALPPTERDALNGRIDSEFASRFVTSSELKTGVDQDSAAIRRLSVSGLGRNLWLAIRNAQLVKDKPELLETQSPSVASAGGRAINRTGGVINERDGGGVNLRSAPTTTGAATSRLAAGTLFLVLEELDGGWYKVKVQSTHETGFVAKDYVTLAPDQGAVLHRITAGQAAIGIAEQYYAGAVGRGEDLRFFVNVLHYVNPSAIPNPSGANWRDAKTLQNYWIWVPSVAFAQTLRGVVNSGSITGGAYDAVKDSAAAVVKATIGQLPGGAEVVKTLEGIGGDAEKVFNNPEMFIKNLTGAVSQGFGQFAANIGTHLQSGMVSVLTGQLGGQVSVPPAFNAEGVLSVGLQLLGLTPQSLERRLEREVPGGLRAVQGVQEAADLLGSVQREGLIVTVKSHFEGLEALRGQVFESIKSWAAVTLVKKAVEVLASALIPGAGIIQAAIKIYETVTFLWEKFKMISATLRAITGSLADIARGNVSSAVAKIVTSLVGGLSLAIGFLVKISGLDGIASRIRAFFKGIRARIDAAITRVVAWFKSKVSRGNANPKPGVGDARKDPEHDKKVARGLDQIDAEEARIDAKDNDGKLTKAQAEAVAATVKRNNPIFKRIIVHYEIAKNEINYEWFASNGIRKSNRKPYTDDLEPAADEGTKTNPFPLDWAKPASATYPKIFLGGTRTDHKSQRDLAQMVGKMDESGAVVQQYAPHTRAVLPSGETIGLTANYYLDVGTVIGPLAPDGVKSAGGYVINDVLRKYGFRPDKDRLDGDHVHEMQLGGQNVLENLWPLDKSTNRGSGSTIDKADVRLQDGRVIKVYQLRQFVKTSGRKIYFSIRSVA